MTKTKYLLILATLLGACGLARAATIDFTGGTVNVGYYWPDASTLYIGGTNAVVGSGVEYTAIGFETGPNVDISASSILITYPAGWALAGSGTFDGWIIRDAGGDIPAFSSVSLVSNIAGLTSTSLQFDANSIRVDTLGLGSWGNSGFIRLDVGFPSTSVPEPGTLGLLGLALAGAGFVRRKRAA